MVVSYALCLVPAVDFDQVRVSGDARGEDAVRIRWDLPRAPSARWHAARGVPHAHLVQALSGTLRHAACCMLASALVPAAIVRAEVLAKCWVCRLAAHLHVMYTYVLVVWYRPIGPYRPAATWHVGNQQAAPRCRGSTEAQQWHHIPASAEQMVEMMSAAHMSRGLLIRLMKRTRKLVTKHGNQN